MSKDEAFVERIQQLAQPLLAAASAELVELSVHRHGGQVIIRMLVDQVGGVTIQDCARLNRQIGQALETAGFIQEPYTLEVSSPGLDRPLVSKRDFERALGEFLELELREVVQGRRQATGQLLAVQEDAIVLTTPVGNVVIPFAHIQRALKAIHFAS